MRKFLSPLLILSLLAAPLRPVLAQSHPARSTDSGVIVPAEVKPAQAGKPAGASKATPKHKPAKGKKSKKAGGKKKK